MLSELEELRAAFTEEILERRGVEDELERTKTALWAIVFRMGGKVFISDLDLYRKYKFNTYRSTENHGIVIEVERDE